MTVFPRMRLVAGDEGKKKQNEQTGYEKSCNLSDVLEIFSRFPVNRFSEEKEYENHGHENDDPTHDLPSKRPAYAHGVAQTHS